MTYSAALVHTLGEAYFRTPGPTKLLDVEVPGLDKTEAIEEFCKLTLNGVYWNEPDKVTSFWPCKIVYRAMRLFAQMDDVSRDVLRPYFAEEGVFAQATIAMIYGNEGDVWATFLESKWAPIGKAPAAKRQEMKMSFYQAMMDGDLKIYGEIGPLLLGRAFHALILNQHLLSEYDKTTLISHHDLFRFSKGQ